MMLQSNDDTSMTLKQVNLLLLLLIDKLNTGFRIKLHVQADLMIKFLS